MPTNKPQSDKLSPSLFTVQFFFFLTQQQAIKYFQYLQSVSKFHSDGINPKTKSKYFYEELTQNLK